MTDNFADAWTGQPAALIIAHPGHELRIHHWLERARPVTFVLTDGSGHTDRSRINSTTTVLDRAGARRGAIYGAISDRELYRAILSGERDLFWQLVEELAAALRREGVTYVVGDAVEGVNPGHDVCRLIVNAALLRMSGMGDSPPGNMEYPVEGPPDDCPAEDRAQAIRLNLDDDAYQRKVAAAQAYPELASELKRVLAVHNVEAFRVECLRPVRYEMDIKDRFRHPCVYEWYGEKQVAAGIYKDVIRFREHIAPLAADLEGRSRLHLSS
jgi:hypothetical protein